MKNVILILQINFFLLSLINSCFSQNNDAYYPTNATEKIYTDLRIAIYQKENVFRLNLSNQNLKIFPKDIYLLQNLRELILDENQISFLQFQAEKLPNLFYLSIKNNELKEFVIPNNCLNGLKELYLDFNQLIEFPEIDNDFIELKTLSLNNNYIALLPIEDLSLTRLQYLYLDSNPLKNPEQAFEYSNILERLSLYNTKLLKLPNNAFYPRLVKLVISSNPIDLKYFQSKSFPKLEYLDASYCNLFSPESFFPLCNLKNLKYLALDNCRLKKLPPEIANLKKLREITLIRNNLMSFPDVFYNMKLKLINLEENPLSESEKTELKNRFSKASLYF